MVQTLIYSCSVRRTKSVGDAAQDSPSLLKRLHNYVWVPKDCNVETVS